MKEKPDEAWDTFSFNRVKGFKVQGCGGGFAAMLDDAILVSQPSPLGEGNETRIPLFSHCQNKYTHMWKNNTYEQNLP